ncbi:MAG: hypothetical protein H6709_18695 [Kofleriaceae bacterium]|nr:hypothetical protein [Kofleriaceae bacterium]
MTRAPRFSEELDEQEESKMSVTRESVLEALGRVVTRGIRLTALADDMGLRKQEYVQLEQIVKRLADDGVVHRVAGGAWALSPTGRSADRKAGRRRPPRPRRGPAARRARHRAAAGGAARRR